MKARIDYPVMTVKELIAELEKMPNQDGKVDIGISFDGTRATVYPYLRGSKFQESDDYYNYAVKPNPFDNGARLFVNIGKDHEGKIPCLTWRKK